MIVPKSIAAMASVSLIAIIVMSLSSREVTSDTEDKSKCAIILEDLKKLMLTRQINTDANSKKPLLLAIMLNEPDRREIAKKCEKICKDCPHEGGKMCNCDNYTLDTDDQWPSREIDYSEPEFDDFEDLDANVEEKPNFFRSK